MNGGLGLALAGAAGAALSGVPGLVLGPGRPAAERLGALLAVLASVVGLAGACLGLAGPPDEVAVPWAVPGLSLRVGLDPLSALFLVPVFLVPALAAVYGLGYAPLLGAAGRHLRVFQGLLTAGMATLVLARNGMLFLVGWELMALSAFLLIATEHHHARTRRAAWIYLVTTHFCTLCLAAVMVLLQTPDGRLDWVPEAFAALSRSGQVVVWSLALLGFGLKAGMMPLHVWLPGAHGNAPSHVSAVLSGVLIKMGAYGMLRLAAMLPPPPFPFAVAVLGVGATTALLGVAATLAQGDLKRLLAYSSIENVGIVFLGLGLGLVGESRGDHQLEVLGFGGAVFHVLNHSLFKPLLFLGAGSVVHGAGTRELDRLGGLAARMPRTAFAFTCGAAAISGLPLGNGFVGEFVLYLGLFGAALRPDPFVGMLGAVAVGVLAMVGGLAVATFVRSVAAVFLGRPRSPEAAAAHEAPVSMTTPMLLLAGLCALVGFAPSLVVPWLDAAVGVCAHGRPVQLAAEVPFAAVSWVVFGTSAAALLVGRWLVAVRRRSAAGTPAVGTWDCGFVDASAPQLQYTGTSFAQAGARVLTWTVRQRIVRPAPFEILPAPRRLLVRAVEPLLHGVFRPLLRRVADRCSRLRVLQRGKPQVYLLYILLVLIGLLSWSALAV